MARRQMTGRVMAERDYLDKYPDKTQEDYDEMLEYSGGRGGDIGGGNYVVGEDGVPRNREGQVKPGWKPSRGQGALAVEGHKAASGTLRREIATKKTLLTGQV